ncbi:MAG: hypothetical protein LBK56_01515 [Gracilibacteraceae bacterium]|nr:hypothetical protein [Gracilibacteraceae bacterium]
MLFTEFNLSDAKRIWREEGVEEGIEKGIEKGMEKGETLKAFAIAKNLFAMNISLEQVIAATGLTREEAEGLR